MSSRKKIRGILATTHIDRHGERFSREALEKMAQQDLYEQPVWVNWDHQTTIPPIGFATRQYVEQCEDGEFQIVHESELFDPEDYVPVPLADIGGLDVNEGKIEGILAALEPSPEGSLQILFDPRNFSSDDVQPIIESMNELVPTVDQVRMRKAELPQPVIWVIVAFLGGMIARYGEVLAEKTISAAKPLLVELNERFARFLSLNPNIMPDVIFVLEISDSNTHVEGAVEEADKGTLEIGWQKLPELYALAAYIIDQNRKDYLADLKFLFNPLTKKWEVNFFTVRETKRVIRGPRYYDPSNPLRERWERELKRIQGLADEKSDKK